MVRFLRIFVAAAGKKTLSTAEPSSKAEKPEDDESSSGSEDESLGPKQPLTRDDLLAKLNALMISKRSKDDDDEFGSDSDGLNFTDDEDEDDDD